MALQNKFGSKFGAAVPVAKKKAGDGVRRELANFFTGSAAGEPAKAPAPAKKK
jgi:hypothetical protein